MIVSSAMAPVLFFESISIPPPSRNIYRRLGFVKGVTDVPALQKEEIERYIRDASSLIHLKGAGLRTPIAKIKAPRLYFLTVWNLKVVNLPGFLPIVMR